MLPVAILILFAFVFLVPALDSGTIGAAVVGSFLKGSHVGAYSTPNPTAPTEINEDPYELATFANLDIETYTLARMISSEEGNSSNLRQIAVAWVAKNNSRGSIFGYATDGSYGKQGGQRPVSTFQDPYQGHVDIAKAVIAGTIPDPTGGATNFIAPKTQDTLHARDATRWKTFAEVDAAWQAKGLRPVTVDGIDPTLLQFYA